MEERRSFWSRLFGGSRRPVRLERVLEYIVYRLSQGARLEEVVGEEYVRRQATVEELGRMLDDPRIVESARERMQREFGSEEMAPGRRPRRKATGRTETRRDENDAAPDRART